jgi:hypothetical protein
MPEEEYVPLFGTGGIGFQGISLIRLEQKVKADTDTFQGLDLGGADTEIAAVVYWECNGLRVRRMGQLAVTVSSRAVAKGEGLRLATGDMIRVTENRKVVIP